MTVSDTVELLNGVRHRVGSATLAHGEPIAALKVRARRAAGNERAGRFYTRAGMHLAGNRRPGEHGADEVCRRLDL